MSNYEDSQQYYNATMNDATPMPVRLTPPASNKTAVNNSKRTSQEMERTQEIQYGSPPKKTKMPSEPSSLKTADLLFQKTAAGASTEVGMLLSKFADALSEMAAADTSQMKELDAILTEAKHLELFLKEKKKTLKQTLALISDKLQG